MNKESQELQKVIADLKLIKEAVNKNDNIIRFICAGNVLRGILLTTGLLIAVFSAIFYYLLEQYGSFGAVPINLRIILFGLIGLSVLGIGCQKIRNFIRNAQNNGIDINFNKLVEEVSTPRFMALHLPNIIVIILAIIFLDSRGYELYIIPSIAVLYGLLVISLSSLIFLKELYFLGIWLISTGVLTLFTAEAIHPLAVLGITFAAGMLLASLLFYVGQPGEKR
ncbi:hypothetical protein [Candidatus Contubernalis alkaliaceticus]|uniref:hypothetical protein n=1 Tax=Candidatus Contubernalis alkaliaceticus TaxID=338645 RepID=UPI001F4BE234|nr:hypothetical protein [Candidatus Contubernalis alkalaceticus]UNC91037.1 hypothetical protein HUE98_02425 [Candidatus Contubernalis alkalaceticus]